MTKLQHTSNVILFYLSAFEIVAILTIGLATNFQSHNVFAQQNSTNTTASQIDSFSAQGQISSLAADTLAGREDNSTENVIWVLGGDWEFNVADGNLTNFVVDIEMTQVDGTAAHKHTIEKLNNATGMPMGTVEPLELNFMRGEPSSKIALVNNNSTMFRGTADLTTNEDIKWTSVPVHVTLQNGNILNINIDPSKTEDHFEGLPVFGTVQSIVDENGKELVKK